MVKSTISAIISYSTKYNKSPKWIHKSSYGTKYNKSICARNEGATNKNLYPTQKKFRTPCRAAALVNTDV